MATPHKEVRRALLQALTPRPNGHDPFTDLPADIAEELAAIRADLDAMKESR